MDIFNIAGLLVISNTLNRRDIVTPLTLAVYIIMPAQLTYDDILEYIGVVVWTRCHDCLLSLVN